MINCLRSFWDAAQKEWPLTGQTRLPSLHDRPIERAFDSVGLLDDVDAVLVGFDHFADAFEMALDGGQAVQDLLLVGLHDC